MSKVLSSKISDSNDLYALQFDGSALSCATSTSIVVGGEVSVEAVIKITTMISGVNVVGFGTSGSADRFYISLVNSGGLWKLVGNIRSTSTATLYSITGTTTIAINNIYHVSISYSSTTNTFRLFLNGTQEGSDLTVSVGAINNRVFGIGGTGVGGFIGVVDNARFYKRELTIAEVLDHSTGTFSDNTSLNVLWRLNVGFGTGVPDTSSSNNHGTILSPSTVQWVSPLVNW